MTVRARKRSFFLPVRNKGKIVIISEKLPAGGPIERMHPVEPDIGLTHEGTDVMYEDISEKMPIGTFDLRQRIFCQIEFFPSGPRLLIRPVKLGSVEDLEAPFFPGTLSTEHIRSKNADIGISFCLKIIFKPCLNVIVTGICLVSRENLPNFITLC